MIKVSLWFCCWGIYNTDKGSDVGNEGTRPIGAHLRSARSGLGT